MLEGAQVPRSPAWWVKQLAAQLQDRRAGRVGTKRWTRNAQRPQQMRPGLDMLHDYLVGEPPLGDTAAGWEDHFREVVRMARLNVAEMAVSTKSDYMELRGFRTSEADDELGDKAAQQLMRATDYKVKARETHDHTLSLAEGYMMVTPPRDTKWPVITAEDPRETITAHDPATGATLASLTMKRDDWDSADFIHLYVRKDALAGYVAGGDPTEVVHYIAKKQSAYSSIGSTSAFRLTAGWEWQTTVDGTDDSAGTLPMQPIIRFRNRRGVGEYERHLPTIDRINDQILDKLVIGKIQAFRQMGIKGLPDTKDVIVDGKRTQVEIDYTDAFTAAPGSLWQLPDGSDIWESAVTDMRPLLQAIKDDLEHFAAVTSTPLHTITPDAAQGSAEGAGLMKESRTSAVRSCVDNIDRSHAAVAATAFAFMDDADMRKRGDVTEIETLWGPIERYSLAERADAASKAGTSLPREAIQRDIWQYDPAEIQNLRTLQGREMLYVPSTRVPNQSAPNPPVPTPPALPPAPGATRDA